MDHIKQILICSITLFWENNCYPGGLAHSVTDHSVGLVGASGGVYALLGAHCAAIIIVSIGENMMFEFFL